MASLQQPVAAVGGGDALEFEQARLRVAIHAVLALYFAVFALWDRVPDDGEVRLLATFAGIMMLGFAQLRWTVLRPGMNRVRRCAGVVLDIGTVTLMMLLGGEAGVIMYAFYLWIIIGNGFRFGRDYLHFAQALALTSFLAVVLVDPFWRGQPILAAALALVLIAIPAYVAALLGRLSAESRCLQDARGEAEAAHTAKTRFLAAASHDLRQPMQALSMYASVLEGRVGDAAGTLPVVRGIQLSVHTLEQLFDGLLDSSKIESGVVRPSFASFPLLPLMQQVVDAERPAAEHKHLELTVVPTAASARSDPDLLERILRSLVANAVRYTERGRIVVGCRRAGAGRLRLQVADSGIGIPLEQQERLFQQRGAGVQGPGLGLPIVKSLADLLGHAVSLRSAPGRGSVFSIELERTEAAVEPMSQDVSADALRGMTVLVVDDDREIRESIRLLFEGWGCRCIVGASAAEVDARLRAAGGAPDALIADYRLAGSATGVQEIGRLRAAFGAGLPALIITGTANLITLQREAAGIPFVVKPVRPGKLRAFLSQALRGRPAAA